MLKLAIQPAKDYGFRLARARGRSQKFGRFRFFRELSLVRVRGVSVGGFGEKLRVFHDG